MEGSEACPARIKNRLGGLIFLLDGPNATDSIVSKSVSPSAGGNRP
jgi:hypothetical protein